MSGAEVGSAENNPADLDQPTPRVLCSSLHAHKVPDADRILAAAFSYERNQREEFGREHDHFKLVGQDNVRRYRPLGVVHVRVHPDDTGFEVFARACAAHVAGCRVVISTPPNLNLPAVKCLEELSLVRLCLLSA